MVNHDVGRFQIPVEDSTAMGLLHGSCNLKNGDRGEFFGKLAVVPDMARQRVAFDQSHRNVVCSIDDTDIENRAEVRVSQIRS